MLIHAPRIAARSAATSAASPPTSAPELGSSGALAASCSFHGPEAEKKRQGARRRRGGRRAERRRRAGRGEDRRHDRKLRCHASEASHRQVPCLLELRALQPGISRAARR